jgi:hypothetical protein
MNYPMKYPAFPDMNRVQRRLQEFARLKFEYGTNPAEICKVLGSAYASFNQSLELLLSLPEDAA